MASDDQDLAYEAEMVEAKVINKIRIKNMQNHDGNIRINVN